jgi:hypothetical protein
VPVIWLVFKVGFSPWLNRRRGTNVEKPLRGKELLIAARQVVFNIRNFFRHALIRVAAPRSDSGERHGRPAPCR